MSFEDGGVLLQTHKGMQKWAWQEFSEFKETMNFFLLYFDGRSFFMVPKDAFKRYYRNSGSQATTSGEDQEIV